MVHVKQTKRSDVKKKIDVGFMAQRRRNPRIARREICMFIYIHMYIYIYIHVCFSLLGTYARLCMVLIQQSEGMPEFICGHAICLYVNLSL